MAKRKPASEPTTRINQTHALPEGYEKRSDDVVGFWNPESNAPLHFIPREAAVFDGKDEPEKPAIIVFGELVDAVQLEDAEGNPVDGQPGDRIGLWGKPGMKALKGLCGVKVFMFLSGEKDVGKPQPMKVFEVASSRDGDPLPVDDRRKLSRRKGTFLTPATNASAAAPSNGRRRQELESDDDFGF